eukprot:5850888-Karenia_brevis.AAC.1
MTSMTFLPPSATRPPPVVLYQVPLPFSIIGAAATFSGHMVTAAPESIPMANFSRTPGEFSN